MSSTQRWWESSVWRGILVVGIFVFTLYDGVLAFVPFVIENSDFHRMYSSTTAFLHGEDMYGLNPSTAVGVPDLHHVDQEQTLYLWNMNPPHLHLILLPVAFLPLKWAIIPWGLAGFLCLFLSGRIVFQEAGLEWTSSLGAPVLAWTLGTCAMATTLSTGQLSFLLLLPVVCMWRAARRGNWGRAGAWLGLTLSVKPFLLILVPYLLLRRHWTALAACAGVTVLCFAVGLAVFGIDNHISWRTRLEVAGGWAWLPSNGSLLGFLERTLGDTPSYEPLTTLSPSVIHGIWFVLAVVFGLLTVGATALDRSPESVDRAFAILLLSAIFLSPLGWTYYAWLPLGPMLAVGVSWWRERPSPPRWSWRLATVFLVGFLWPVWATTVFQPAAWATPLFANVYFWASLAAWLALFLDFYGRYRPAVEGMEALP